MGTVAAEDKNEYRNDTGGQLGVVIEDVDGKPQGIAVPPNDTVWLSESERIRTANAPRDPKNNPFANGSLVKVTEGGQIKSKRAIDTETIEPEEQPEPVPPAPGALPTAETEGGVPREERPPDDQQQPPPPAPPERTGDDETGSTPTPATPPVEGAPAPGEEVATPQAPTGAPNVRSGPEIEPPPAPAPDEPASVVQTPSGPRRTAVKRSGS